jgi:methionine-gamma-lyase
MTDTTPPWSLASAAVYQAPDAATGAIAPPIHVSSSFQYDEAIYQEVVAGARETVNIYGRCGNPGERLFQDHLARVEGADAVLATASGMAAVTTTLFGLLKQGDHLVCDWTTYSSTHEFLAHRAPDFGIETTFVDMADAAAVRAALRPETKVLYFEAIANPTMKVVPIAPLAALAEERGLVLVCDNTFASPAVLRPLEHGVDLVIESASKFIGGHNDVIGGAIALRAGRLPADFLERLRWNTMVKWGAPIAPFSAWLLDRGLQTLPLRVERQCENAAGLAAFLEAHPAVERVCYPGLPSHPQHEIAKAQMPRFGAMLAFDVGSEPRALAVVTALKLASFAASLGGVRTVTQIPGTMAFLDIPEAERARMGITPGMVRISAGIEALEDLQLDFAQALGALGTGQGR